MSPASAGSAPTPRGRARPGGQELPVLSLDATGVTPVPSDLRTPAPPPPVGTQPPSAQLPWRERTGRTRMACVTARYDAAPRCATSLEFP
ncbi:hypothetical protein ACFXJ5_38480 [Streptomyces sp. NPDC059373]